jgi:hypothetical protein
VCLVLGEDPENSAATDLIRKTVISANRQRELIGRTVRDGAPLVLFDQADPSEWTAAHFAKILPGAADDEAEVFEAAAE